MQKQIQNSVKIQHNYQDLSTITSKIIMELTEKRGSWHHWLIFADV